MQFFTPGSSKIEVSETFFYMATTHNVHPSFVKHVLGSIYVFFTESGGSWLKEDSLRHGLAKGNRISTCRDLSNALPPFNPGPLTELHVPNPLAPCPSPCPAPFTSLPYLFPHHRAPSFAHGGGGGGGGARSLDATPPSPPGFER